MARDMSRILSKSKWTGEELGRILLAEVVRSIQVAKGEIENSTPIITDEDLTAMEKGLESERNYTVYNIYRNLYFQLSKIYNHSANYMSHFQSAYNREIMHLSDCYNYERTKAEQSKLPVIVTQSKYEELTKDIREELENIGESYAGLIITLAGWFAEHIEKAPAGFAEALEATKTEQVTNKEIAQAWLDYIEGYCLVLPNGLRSDTVTQEEWEKAVQEAFMEKHSMQDTFNSFCEDKLADYCVDTTEFSRTVAFNKYAQNKLMLKWLWEGKEGLRKELKNIGKDKNIDQYYEVLHGMLEEDTADLYDMLDISNYSKTGNSKAVFAFAEEDVADTLLYEELPQTVTKYDIIKEGYTLYYGETEGSDPKEMFKAFIKDYPALYDILDKYVQDLLPIFKGTTPANYHKLQVGFGELERLGVANYTTKPTKKRLAEEYKNTENYDFMTYKRIANSGYAVLQDYVKETTAGELKVHTALRLAVNLEALEAIEIMKTNMLKARDTLFIPAVKYLFAFNSLVDIYAAFFDFEDLQKVKLKESDITLKLDSYNDLVFLLYKNVFGNEEQQNSKRELVKKLFKPLFVEDFKPTELAISQVKAEVEKHGFTKTGKEKFADYEYYISILLGANPNNKNRG